MSEIKKILCVDDEELLRENYKDILGMSGFNVEVAANGVDCGCMLAEFRPDLIIFDLDMPEMGGIKAISTIKKGPFKNVKVLVISGKVADDKIKMLKDLNTPFMKKPFMFNDLVANIKKMEVDDLSFCPSLAA